MSHIGDTEREPDMTSTGVVRNSLHVTSVCIVGLFVIAAVSCAYFAKPVLMPLVLALLTSAVLRPIVARFHRFGIPRAIIAGVLIVLIAAAVVFAGWSFSGPVSNWVSNIPDQIEYVSNSLAELREPVQEVANEVDELAAGADQARDSTIQIEESTLSEFLFSTSRRIVVYFFLTVVLVYFLLSYGHRLTTRLRQEFEHDLIGEMADSVSAYLSTITVINMCLGIVVGLAMWMTDMPNPPIWGTAAFVLNYLPYVGAMIGVSLCAFVTLLTFEDWTAGLLPPAIYFVLTTLEGNLVTPTILGRRFPINPAVLFVWLIFWAWLWGFVGALMAVPMLMAVRLICADVPHLRLVGDLVGDLPNRHSVGERVGAARQRANPRTGARTLPG